MINLPAPPPVQQMHYEVAPVKPVNHALHIILSILTLGAWLFVYVPILIVHGHKAKHAVRVAKKGVR